MRHRCRIRSPRRHLPPVLPQPLTRKYPPRTHRGTHTRLSQDMRSHHRRALSLLHHPRCSLSHHPHRTWIRTHLMPPAVPAAALQALLRQALPQTARQTGCHLPHHHLPLSSQALSRPQAPAQRKAHRLWALALAEQALQRQALIQARTQK